MLLETPPLGVQFFLRRLTIYGSGLAGSPPDIYTAAVGVTVGTDVCSIIHHMTFGAVVSPWEVGRRALGGRPALPPTLSGGLPPHTPHRYYPPAQ